MGHSLKGTIGELNIPHRGNALTNKCSERPRKGTTTLFARLASFIGGTERATEFRVRVRRFLGRPR
jgi:hypothetical protein